MITPSGVTAAAYSAAVLAGNASHVRMTFANGTVLGDADVDSSGLSLSDVLNGDTDLTFGKAVMKELAINLHSGATVESLRWGDEFTLEMGVEISGVTNWVTVGRFTGSRPDKIHYVDVISFTAYDRMQRFDGLADGYLNGLSGNKTVQQILEGLCTYVGVPYAAGDELSAVMSRSIDVTKLQGRGLSGRDLLGVIAEACGCYARITPAGSLRMTWYAEVDYAVGADDEFRVEAYDIGHGMTWQELSAYTWEEAEQFTWEELGGYNETFRVHGLNVRLTEDDIGVLYGARVGNQYTIVDNPFLLIEDGTDADTYIKPIWERLKEFGGYLPLNVECMGNWLVEAGDMIEVDVHGETIAMPIFVRSMHWGGGCTDVYEATGQIQRVEANTATRMKLAEGGKFHEVKIDIDGLSSRIGDTEGNVSELTQTVNQFGVRLTTAEGDISQLILEAYQIVLQLADKYDRISGITITVDGVEITGNKFVKIGSEGYIQLGEGWKVLPNGMQFTNSDGKILHIGDALSAVYGDVAAQIVPQIDSDGNGQIQFGVSQYSGDTFAGYRYVVLGVNPDTGIVEFRPYSTTMSYLGTLNQQWSYVNCGDIMVVNSISGHPDFDRVRIQPAGQTGHIAEFAEVTDGDNSFIRLRGLGDTLNGTLHLSAEQVDADLVNSTDVQTGKLSLKSPNIINISNTQYIALKPAGESGYYVYCDEETIDNVKYVRLGGADGSTGIARLHLMAALADITALNAGSISATGNISSGGSISATGNIATTGKVTASGNLEGYKIVSNEGEIIGNRTGGWLAIKPNGTNGGYAYFEERTIDNVTYLMIGGNISGTNGKLYVKASLVESGKIVSTDGEIIGTRTGGWIAIKPNGASGDYAYFEGKTVNSVNYMMIDGNVGGYNGKLYVNAALVDAGILRANNLQSTSSREVKHQILPMGDVGERLDQLNPVTFIYNDDPEERVRCGLIHEETVRVMPEICAGDENSKPEDRAINYLELVPMLLKEVQGLRKRVAELEDKVATLERR